MSLSQTLSNSPKKGVNLKNFKYAPLKAVVKQLMKGKIPSTGMLFDIPYESDSKNPLSGYTILATTHPKTNEVEFHRFDPKDPSTRLGEGGNGLVLFAFNLVTEQLTAIKFHYEKSINYAEDREAERRNLKIADRLFGEAKIKVDLSKVMKPDATDSAENGVKDYEVTVMEYCPEVNLQDVLYEVDDSVQDKESAAFIKQKKFLTMHEKLNLSLETLTQILWLHSVGLLHRDTKPDNFMVAVKYNRCVVKVIDLGMSLPIVKVEENTKSTSVYHADTYKEQPGNKGFIAPEMLEKKRPSYDITCDLFSLGVLIAAIVSDSPYLQFVRKKIEEGASTGWQENCEITKADIEKFMPDVFSNSIPENLKNPLDIEIWQELTTVIKLLTSDRITRRYQSLKAFSENLHSLYSRAMLESIENYKLLTSNAKKPLRTLRRESRLNFGMIPSVLAAKQSVSSTDLESGTKAKVQDNSHEHTSEEKKSRKRAVSSSAADKKLKAKPVISNAMASSSASTQPDEELEKITDGITSLALEEKVISTDGEALLKGLSLYLSESPEQATDNVVKSVLQQQTRKVRGSTNLEELRGHLEALQEFSEEIPDVKKEVDKVTDVLMPPKSN